MKQYLLTLLLCPMVSIAMDETQNQRALSLYDAPPAYTVTGPIHTPPPISPEYTSSPDESEEFVPVEMSKNEKPSKKHKNVKEKHSKKKKCCCCVSCFLCLSCMCCLEFCCPCCPTEDTDTAH